MIDAVPLRTEEQMGFAGECLQKKPCHASPGLCKLLNAKRLKTERNSIMQSSNGRKSGKFCKSIQASPVKLSIAVFAQKCNNYS